MGCLKLAYSPQKGPILRCVWNREKESKTHVNLYDYGFRYYDPTLGRWNCIDKLAEKYYPLSPYVYCANNPIKLIDIDGRYFDDENEKRAQRLEKKLIRQQERLAKKVIKMAAKGKDTGDLEARQDELDKSLNDISNMRNNTSTEFRYASVNSEEARNNGIEGPTTRETDTNGKGDAVVTMFNESSMGKILHEGRHGGDIARGNLEFNNTGGYGVSHEVSAYRAEYSWSGKLQYREFMSGDSFFSVLKAGYTAASVNNQLTRTITNINAITPSVVNSIGDGAYPTMRQLYPPRDPNTGALIIPLQIWNNH